MSITIELLKQMIETPEWCDDENQCMLINVDDVDDVPNSPSIDMSLCMFANEDEEYNENDDY